MAKDAAVRVHAAALWAGDRGAVSGEAALWVWGLVARPPSRVTVESVRHIGSPSKPWLKVVESSVRPDVHKVEGVRLVSPAQALVRAWCDLGPEGCLPLVVRLVGTRRVLGADVRTVMAEQPRVRARRKLLALVALAETGVTSYLEHHVTTRVFPPSRYPELTWQYRVMARGKVRYLDGYCERAHLALEFDSYEHHAGEQNRLRDLERDAELATLGISTIRFTYSDLMNRPAWCRAIYETARNARGYEWNGGVAA